MRHSPLRTRLLWGFSLLALIIFGGYSLFEARKLIEGPRVVIEEPKDGATLYDPLVRIAGTAQNAAFLSINDAVVLADAGGHFEAMLTPPAGYEIIKVSATDRFGRNQTLLLHVIVGSGSSPTSTPSGDF